MNTEPIFASAAQETFAAGDIVYDYMRPAAEKHLASVGVYLGYEVTEGGAEMAVVEWDKSPLNGQHAVRRESFTNIRQLYR